MSTFSERPSDPEPAVTDPELVRIWDELQRWQADFCYPLELPVYFSSPTWTQANKVLDIGTGNGYYLRKIMHLFPDKVYTGIDTTAEFINIARGEMRSGSARLEHASLFEWTGEYDFVLMRLVLQHLPDIGAVLDHVAGLVASGGSALIIDAHDAMRMFNPSLPEFMQFFEAYRNHQFARGRNRDIASTLVNVMAKHPQWSLGANVSVVIPSVIPGNGELFDKTYRRVIDMVERVGELEYDFAKVRTAWDKWCQLGRRYTQVGLTLVRLDRR